MIRIARLAACIAAFCLAGCGPITFTIGGPADDTIRSTTVLRDGPWLRDRIALIDVSGLIVNTRPPALFGAEQNPVGILHQKLEAARDDDRVKAVVLRLNTPGGTVTASDAMYREVRRFRATSDKPVIALMMDVAASGGYYVACAADQIVAYPSAVTGSVGVIMQTVSFKPAMDRIGIDADAIVSGPNKAAGSPLSRLTPEQREILQTMVDDFHQQFIEVVRAARPSLTDEVFERMTDGRVLTGERAAEAGLIDRTGDLYDAYAAAKATAGVDRAHLVLYHRRHDYAGSAYAAAPNPPAAAATTQINLAQINLGDTFGLGDARFTFMYLWKPHGP